MAEYETHDYDVIVIGAGGAGLRAAIEAQGPRACAPRSSASRCSARPTRSWPRAAWPPRWATSTPRTTGRSTSATPCAAARCSTTGAWPSCTPRRPPTGSTSSRPGAPSSTGPKDGRILQRDFGGHRYARLAHVGDRTGLELIRTLQQKAVSMDIDVFMECKVLRLLTDADGRVSGAVGYWRPTGEFVDLRRPRRSCWPPAGSASRWKYTSNSWESHRRRPRHGPVGRAPT